MLLALVSLSVATPRFVSVSAGANVTCGIDDRGAVHCAGNERLGAPPVGTFTQVSAGWTFACALGTDHAVRCWGDGLAGSFRDPTREITRIAAIWGPSVDVRGVFVLDERGEVRACSFGGAGGVTCGEPVEYRTQPGRVTDIAATERFVYAIDAAGLTAWSGDDFHHRTGEAGGRFRAIDAGGASLCGLRPEGTLLCWGVEWREPAPGQRFAQLSVGGIGLCALTAEGALSCWGRELEPLTTPGGAFTAVSVGRMHTCAIDGAGAIHCWGRDEGGHGSPPGEPEHLENRYVAVERLELRSLPAGGEVIGVLPLGERCRTREPGAAAPLWVCGLGQRRVGYLDAASLSPLPPDEGSASFQLNEDLERVRARLREERDPVARGRLLLEERRVHYAGGARLCGLTRKAATCGQALEALADATLATFDRSRLAEAPCPSPDSCLPGPVRVEEKGEGGETLFVSFAAEGARTRTVVGTWDGKVLRLGPASEGEDPLLGPVLEALLSQGFATLSLEPPLTAHEWGSRFGRFEGELGPAWAAASDVVLCEEGGRYAPGAPGPLSEPFVDTDMHGGRLFESRLHRMPCSGGWVFDPTIPGISRAPVTGWPISDTRFLEGPRVLTFGAVTFEQRRDPAGMAHCVLTGPKGTQVLATDEHCRPELAADLNRDGVPDFVMASSSGEGCVTKIVWMSGRKGWTAVAERRWCD